VDADVTYTRTLHSLGRRELGYKELQRNLHVLTPGEGNRRITYVSGRVAHITVNPQGEAAADFETFVITC
jgi:hypothetical protein